jgi:hypothetical protein
MRGIIPYNGQSPSLTLENLQFGTKHLVTPTFSSTKMFHIASCFQFWDVRRTLAFQNLSSTVPTRFRAAGPTFQMLSATVPPRLLPFHLTDHTGGTARLGKLTGPSISCSSCSVPLCLPLVQHFLLKAMMSVQHSLLKAQGYNVGPIPPPQGSRL